MSPVGAKPDIATAATGVRFPEQGGLGAAVIIGLRVNCDHADRRDTTVRRRLSS